VFVGEAVDPFKSPEDTSKGPRARCRLLTQMRLAKATRARKNIGLPMTGADMRQHGVGPLLHRATGGAMEAPPCITFSRWRTLTPALFQDTRHGPATKVWDETEFLNLPGQAAGRHHCR
jgi:hypothetical protein